MMKMNQMKYYNLIIYYMSNIKNSPFLIGGGVAIGLGLIYFTYNQYQGITNSSTSERQTSVDSDPDIGPPPLSREPSVDNQTRNDSNDSTSTYGEFFSGGSKNKKNKKLRKTMRKKHRKGNKSRRK